MVLSAAVADEILIVQTPLRRRFAVALGSGGIRSSEWLERGERRSRPMVERPSALAREVTTQLDAYFARKLTHFDLPLDFQGTAFTVAIWQTVSRIPFGMTVSYADVARVANRPGAHRGVARAMAQLNFALFVPAHRVIGADGRIKGSAHNSMREKLYAFEMSSVGTH